MAAANRWEAHLRSIPTDLTSLKAAYPAPLPRLSLNSIGIVQPPVHPTDTPVAGDELNAILAEFGVAMCDRMLNPTVNPMVTSQQSATQLRAALERERSLLRGSSKPTVSQMSALFPGDFAIVQLVAGGALELVHITKIEGARGPTESHLVFYANVYEQTPNEAHAGGLFGTFKEKLVPASGQRQKTQRSKFSMRLRRDQVRVFNVRPLGNGAQRRLNLATLRLVAEVDERPHAMRYQTSFPRLTGMMTATATMTRSLMMTALPPSGLGRPPHGRTEVALGASPAAVTPRLTKPRARRKVRSREVKGTALMTATAARGRIRRTPNSANASRSAPLLRSRLTKASSFSLT